MKSIGIYPGTFDPIHKGHLAFAQAARTTCRLDEVYFVPEQDPRNKTNVRQLSERTTNIRSFLQDDEGMDVSNLTSNRFTVQDTLTEIESRFGPASYTLLMGSDVALTLERWPDCEELLKEWSIAIGMRRTDTVEAIERVLERIEHTHHLSIHRTYVRTDMADVSSSSLRSLTDDSTK